MLFGEADAVMLQLVTLTVTEEVHTRLHLPLGCRWRCKWKLPKAIQFYYFPSNPLPQVTLRRHSLRKGCLASPSFMLLGDACATVQLVTLTVTEALQTVPLLLGVQVHIKSGVTWIDDFVSSGLNRLLRAGHTVRRSRYRLRSKFAP